MCSGMCAEPIRLSRHRITRMQRLRNDWHQDATHALFAGQDNVINGIIKTLELLHSNPQAKAGEAGMVTNFCAPAQN